MSSTSSLKELLSAEKDFITNASNLSAYIYHNYEQLNWVGFYMMNEGELLLSAFQGKPACIRIGMGKGVCGTAAKNRKPIIVDDVSKFEGHIACDTASQSELVIPILDFGKLYGVLDIDSPITNRFSQKELDEFSAMVDLLIEHTDMDRIFDYYNPY